MTIQQRRNCYKMQKLTLMTCIDICRTNEQSSKQVKTLQSAEDEIAKISIKPNKCPTDIRPAWKTENVDKLCMYCRRHHARKKELCPACGKQWTNILDAFLLPKVRTTQSKKYFDL